MYLFRNISILACCQAIFICGQTSVFFVGALIGYDLADDKALATLPVTMVILGTACMTIPASFYMGRFGRRFGFMTGAVFGLAGALIAMGGILAKSFEIFCLGAFLLGCYNAFCQYYRFAVADTVPESKRAKAISWVLAGGVVAGFLGPQMVIWTKNVVPSETYFGSYIAILVIIMCSFGLVNFLKIPKLSVAEQAAPQRPLWQIMTSRKFATAAISGMIAYGIMSLLMTATPLAMVNSGMPDNDAGFVIQWHVLGMFGPSFFAGWLITKIGLYRVLTCGVVLCGLSPLIALRGFEFVNFWLALFVVGLGWNFTFVAATTLLTQVHTLSERAKVQAANDFLVFGTTATASFVSGTILHNFGWNMVNYIALPLAAGVLILILISAFMEQREQKALGASS
jgi:MFS family permease